MRHFPRALALFTAATLMLTGCSSLLEQEYTHITPRNIPISLLTMPPPPLRATHPPFGRTAIRSWSTP